MTSLFCKPGIPHRFDPGSGWCVTCGRVRDDGAERRGNTVTAPTLELPDDEEPF